MSRWLNLDLANYKGSGRSFGFYEVPELDPVQTCDATEWMGFNYCLSDRRINEKKKKTGVHFFLNDSEFERTWAMPHRYGELLADYNCCFSPEFSIFGVFPTAVRIWNHYRKHWIARYWQDLGRIVIPTIAWGDEENFSWCFDGEPKHSIVAVSNIGRMRNKKDREDFNRGYEEMLKRLEPIQILFYARHVYDYPGNVKYIKFQYFKGEDGVMKWETQQREAKHL